MFLAELCVFVPLWTSLQSLQKTPEFVFESQGREARVRRLYQWIFSHVEGSCSTSHARSDRSAVFRKLSEDFTRAFLWCLESNQEEIGPLHSVKRDYSFLIHLLEHLYCIPFLIYYIYIYVLFCFFVHVVLQMYGYLFGQSSFKQQSRAMFFPFPCFHKSGLSTEVQAFNNRMLFLHHLSHCGDFCWKKVRKGANIP